MALAGVPLPGGPSKATSSPFEGNSNFKENLLFLRVP